MRRLAALLIPLAGATGPLAGCGDSSGPRRLPPPPTLLLVDPVDFLGQVPCLDQPGAMRRYVATLSDVTDASSVPTTDGGARDARGGEVDSGPGGEPDLGDGGEAGSLDGDTPDPGDGGPADAGGVAPPDAAAHLEGFELPSSGPVPCGRSVTFGFVVPGRRYVADVAAWDRADLSPLGGAGSGSPLMVDRDGTVVPPRWTTTCGQPAAARGVEPISGRFEPAVSYYQRTIPVRGCAPLVDAVPPGSTGSLSVSLERALGGLECGDGPSRVGSFRARVGDTELSATCNATVVFEGLEPGGHTVTVQAFESGAPSPSWGTTCFQVVVAGVTRTAPCGALVNRGALRIDVPGLLQGVGLPCAGGSPRARATVTGPGLADPRVLGPSACDTPFVVGDLEMGVYEAVVTTAALDGSPGPSAACEATVQPGVETVAACVASAPR